jgi:biotin carboxyl carrier protein
LIGDEKESARKGNQTQEGKPIPLRLFVRTGKMARRRRERSSHRRTHEPTNHWRIRASESNVLRDEQEDAVGPKKNGRTRRNMVQGEFPNQKEQRRKQKEKHVRQSKKERNSPTPGVFGNLVFLVGAPVTTGANTCVVNNT